jgi:hypothetical protein
MTIRLATCVALTTLFLGCGPATGSGNFNVQVTSGTTPTITWDASGGAAAGLAVAEYPGTSVRTWVLSTTGTGFASGVKYGTVPSGGIEAEGAAKPITAGREYNVTITSLAGGTGSLTFTP